MPSSYLYKFLTAPAPQSSKSVRIFWLSLSLTFAAIYGILGLQQAFSAEYVVQDDARQHVFWMQRFLDPKLFPDDLIANYFQSVAPIGYMRLYQTMAVLGIPPLLLSKLLPLLLGLIATISCFGVTMQLLPVPIAGFISTLLLNQSLWMQDGLISATPKAFVYPIFLHFLYSILKNNLGSTIIAIALLGLFYPQYVFVASGILILQLIEWKKRHFSWSRNRQNYFFSAACLAVAFFVLLPYALNASEFGPTIAVSQAKILPEFLSEGKSKFFIDDPWAFWFHGRSGIGLSAALTPALMAAAFLLPLLLRFPDRFPLAKQVSAKVNVLVQLLIASLGMFFAAHALLFKLHLPSRYTQHSLRMVMAFAAAIALTLILDSVWHWTQKLRKLLIFLPLAGLLFTGLIFYPQWAMNSFPWTYYQVGHQPELYQFFQQQPKNVTIASLSEEANNIPTFAHRSILTAREYAIPYHLGYYEPLRDRTEALIRAQFSPNLADVQAFVKNYNVDLWLVDKGAFTPSYITENRWLRQHEAAPEASAHLEQGSIAAITTLIQRCTVFENYGTIVLQANCILKVSQQ